MTHTLASPATAELEVRRSRFLALVTPVEDREAALAEVARLRAEHPAAAHVCWALLAGGHSGMSDDGEPSGTAGRPILEVLRHHDLDGVLGAVVRYFGGVKLGAGGLVRAYTDAVALAVAGAEKVERIPETVLRVEADYADAERVRRWAEAEGYAEPEAEYGEAVLLLLRVPAMARDATAIALADLSNGRVRIAD
ncbi:IMPACT family protein [Leifsonia shinshuensis]|uniref:Putative YigZ family protein n=1 Tax=Leifsonia shinshuensis TaxID=150026 RepID=A0A853CXE2_9MICO|nr:YigZ family protein [Leifsonia shinshuensis]NYJ23470.1 putative YigZ family protein [Leifsonia shinshuensis]